MWDGFNCGRMVGLEVAGGRAVHLTQASTSRELRRLLSIATQGCIIDDSYGDFFGTYSFISLPIDDRFLVLYRKLIVALAILVPPAFHYRLQVHLKKQWRRFLLLFFFSFLHPLFLTF